MKRIRINNDFTFAWAIERNGLAEDLSVAINKRLWIRNSTGTEVEINDYTIAGNIISVEVTPILAPIMGRYAFKFQYELPDLGLSDYERLCEVDVDAFIIVPRTAEADDSKDMLVASDMAIGFKGDAFMYADFTPEQLEALKVKGDAFVYADFTPEQLEGLKVKGDTGKYGETKFVINYNMELEQHTLIGDPLNFSLVDDELVLTEGGETVNLGTVVYKNPNVIDMQPGQYLSDIIQTIVNATLENPVTINFYNHSKTVNWATFTEKIHWPRHVYLNFVGKINPWPNVYNPGMGFHAGLLSSNPTDKLFLGFSFNRTNDDSAIKVSGLPENVQKVFFGGLDQSYQIAGSYQNLIDNPEDWGEFEFGLVRVNGSKDDDVRNDALYKKINGVFVDVTPDFRYVDFSGCDLELSYFYSANNQWSNFGFANNQGAIFVSANNQGANFGSANNQGANFGYSNNQWSNFGFANNQGVNFGSANNQGAQFDSANNQGAYFDSANNQGAYFYSANNQGANFGSSNNQGAYFGSSNLKNVDWSNVISIVNANFQNADLTGGVNLPERINTKAKWIAECGAGNVNAQTIWIDGTSILS